MNLPDLLTAGESETVEFKSSFNDEALESIGAFANMRGGTVFIGVEDDGEVCGVQIGKRTLEDRARRIQDATDPRLQPSMRIEQSVAKNVVLIQIEQSSRVPVSVRGRFFRRVGRTNQRMSHEEIMRRMLAGAGLSWDAVVEADATWRDLDLRKIRRFGAETRRMGRRPFPMGSDPRRLLEKLGLVQDGRLTRASLLLFGKNPTRFFPSAFLKLGRFRSSTLIVDEREVEGALFEQVDEVMSWFRERLQTAFVITGKPQRDVIWEYPLEAVREAIVNAICHRDYASPASIQIRLYDDRLEIWNPGGLPPSLTPQDLLQEHDSVPRNRQVADAFYFAGLIEKWGTGTIRMASALQEAGLPAPEFDDTAHGRLRVIMRQDPFSETHLRDLGLSDRQMRAVAYVRKHGRITNAAYQRVAEVSERTASRDLSQLVKLGVLSPTGTKGRGVRYTLKAPEKRQTRQKGATKAPPGTRGRSR